MPPVEMADNLAWRAWMEDRGGNDTRWAEAFRRRAFGVDPGVFDPDAVRFWFRGFAWTFDTLGEGEPHKPFIPYGKQEEFVCLLDESLILREPVGADKSRGVGASWGAMGVMVRRWQFDRNADFLVGSQKMEKVDGKGLDALLPKARYMLQYQPEWMLPKGFKLAKPFVTFLCIQNPETGCVLKGEANNPNFARSGRYRAVCLDEHAFMKDADRIQAGVAAATKVYWSISTPDGLGTHQSKLRHGGNVRWISMHWSENPMLSKGLYDCKGGECPLHLDGGKPHSEWYDHQAKVLNMSPSLVAQELDIDYGKSGGAVFPSEIIRRTIAFLEKNPMRFRHYRLEWAIPPDAKSIPPGADPDAWFYQAAQWKVKAVPSEGGPLRVYKEPNPAHLYVVGGDTSRGLEHGDYDSLPVLDVTDGEVVAEWHGRASTEQLGVIGAQLCKWYGTSSGCGLDALGAVEWNGSGLNVNKIMDKLGCVLHRSEATGNRSKKGKRVYLGVVIGPNKRRLINEFLLPYIERTTENGLPELVDPFVEAWREYETFIEYDNGQGAINPETVPVGARRGCHDDRVMARLSMMVGAITRFGRIKGNVWPEKRAEMGGSVRPENRAGEEAEESAA